MTTTGPATPQPNGFDRAHVAMQQHIPNDRDPAACRCGDRHPCYTRGYARHVLIDAGHLVIDRRPPRGAR